MRLLHDVQCARHSQLRNPGQAFGLHRDFSEFVNAAAHQAETLGLPEVRRVFIPHPMQDRTDEEMHAHAERYIDEILDVLMQPVA